MIDCTMSVIHQVLESKEVAQAASPSLSGEQQSLHLTASYE
jgi:hypothetical protein